MIERHAAVEPYVQKAIHRELPSGIGQAHHDAVDAETGHEIGDIRDRAHDTRVEHRHADPCRIRIDESDDVDAELLPPLEQLPCELDARPAGADEQ